METGQTCRVTPNPLSHPLATQKGSHLGVPAIPSLHQAGRRCCWHWSKKALSLPCLPCSPSCYSPKSLNREKPKPQISPALFPGSLEGTAKEGRQEEGRPGHPCQRAAQHLGILLMASPTVQGCITSDPCDRKQLFVFPPMPGSCRRDHT